MINNIDPHLWGESFWGTIYYITFSYPDVPSNDNKQNAKYFFVVLTQLLPCETCRHHYRQNLEKNPLTDDVLSSKQKLLKWVVDLQNEVNSRLGKNTVTITQVTNKYLYPSQNQYHTQYFTQYNNLIIIFALIAIIILLILYVKFR